MEFSGATKSGDKSRTEFSGEKKSGGKSLSALSGEKKSGDKSPMELHGEKKSGDFPTRKRRKKQDSPPNFTWGIPDETLTFSRRSTRWFFFLSFSLLNRHRFLIFRCLHTQRCFSAKPPI